MKFFIIFSIFTILSLLIHGKPLSSEEEVGESHGSELESTNSE